MIGLFFGGQTLQPFFGNLYGNIELDAVLEEAHEWSAEVTSNPVEDGQPVTDQVIEQSDKLRLKCFVTDAPLTLSSSILGFFNSARVGNRTQPVFDLLRELLKLKEPVTVYTKHRLYTDMILSNVSVPRASAVGEALEFNVDFVHIRKVKTQLVDVPKGISSKKSAKAGGANGSTSKKSDPKKDAGKKQAETIQKPTSTLLRGTNVILGGSR
jgi:hypothetical protein